MDFYKTKPRDIPRRIYRNLVEDIDGLDHEDPRRKKYIDNFINIVKERHKINDFLRLRLFVPGFLKNALSEPEASALESTFDELRKKRRNRFFLLYPGCNDEVSVDQNFLSSIFDNTPVPIITKSTNVYTIGSCFATNVRKYLASKGYKTSSFFRSDEINSVFSNLLLLEVARMAPTEQRQYVVDCYRSLIDSSPSEDRIKEELLQFSILKNCIENAHVIIFTLGNTIDGYLPSPVSNIANSFTFPNIFPRFLQAFQTNNIKHQIRAVRVVKSRGGQFNLGTGVDVKKALSRMMDILLEINPSAQLIFTVSPIPINNAMGLNIPGSFGSIEIDCQTKTTLRANFGEVLIERKDQNVHYFPSFEIVRWIGANLSTSAYGAEDASTGHVSDYILNAIYEFFISKYGTPESE